MLYHNQVKYPAYKKFFMKKHQPQRLVPPSSLS